MYSLKINAFRGFNKTIEFQFDDSNLIILYGPNGHGKSSFFDAIEWCLTGKIDRFEMRTANETRKTRFIKNHNAPEQERAYVEMVVIKNSEKYVIQRACTVKLRETSDYDKSDLKILKVDGTESYSGEEAEKILDSWLIHEAWREKIGKPSKMLNLTHVLSQEKLDSFIRVTEEKERYNALSHMFGTDYLSQYEEGFRDTKKSLNDAKKNIETRLDEKEKNLKSLRQGTADIEEINDLNVIQKAKTTVQKYIAQNHKLLEREDNYQEIFSTILAELGQQEMVQGQIEAEFKKINELNHFLPRLQQSNDLRKFHQIENNYYQQYNLTKELIGHINNLKVQSNDIQKIAIMKRDLENKINILVDKISGINKEIELIKNVKQLILASRVNGDGYIELPVNEIVTTQDIQSLLSERAISEDETKIQQSLLEKEQQQLNEVKQFIAHIEETEKNNQFFLKELYTYLENVDEHIDECPVCGTPSIKKETLIQHLVKKQNNINPKLPELLSLQAKHTDSILQRHKAMTSLQQSIKAVNSFIDTYIQKLEQAIQQNIELLKNHQQSKVDFEKRIKQLVEQMSAFSVACERLAIEVNDQVGSNLDKLKKSEIDKLEVTKLQRDQQIAKISALPEFFKEKWNNINFVEYGLELERLRKECDELTTEFLNKCALVKDAEIREIKDTVLERNEQILVNSLNAIKEKVENHNDRINITEEAKKSAEFLRDSQQIAYNYQQITNFEAAIVTLTNQKTMIQTDLDIIDDLIKKSRITISNLNNKMMSDLEETIQIIFEQINSHPVFKRLGLEHKIYRNNNVLNINVSKDEVTKVNASYIFSSAQINGIALSIFLAMAIKQKWTSLNILAMDDPIQSMDEINVVSYIDLMRNIVKKYQKQIIISTHNESFYKLMIKKFRNYNFTRIEYDAYGESGPKVTIDKNNGDRLEKYQEVYRELEHLDTLQKEE